MEEVPDGITHALLMKEGHIVAMGPAHLVINDETLSETFDIPLHVTRDGQRWAVRSAGPQRAQQS